MKAYKLYDIGDLRYEDSELPVLQDGWALVKVRACGICSSDIPRIFLKGTYHFPTIPGHEFSGIVVNVANIEDRFWLNKRVSVFPLIPCYHCESCIKKHYETCANYDYLGSRRDGGFAEFVAVPVWNLVEISDNTDFIEGAMFEPFAVALHAINQANLKGGESIAVVGTGTIAFAISQWAKVKGAREICVIGRRNDKKYIADKIGVSFATSKSMNELYDIVIEAVGTPASLSTAISSVKSGGTIVLMGNPSKDMLLDQSIYWRILRQQLRIVGSWNSSYDGKEMSEWLLVRDSFSRKLINGHDLITHKISQMNLIYALQMMNHHNVSYCKVMTIWNEEDIQN